MDYHFYYQYHHYYHYHVNVIVIVIAIFIFNYFFLLYSLHVLNFKLLDKACLVEEARLFLSISFRASLILLCKIILLYSNSLSISVILSPPIFGIFVFASLSLKKHIHLK